MDNKYVSPEYRKRSFNCPICGAFSSQTWKYNLNEEQKEYVVMPIDTLPLPIKIKDKLSIAICKCCGKFSIWYEEEMIYPNQSNAPMSVDDLPKECYEDYMEARDIFNRSPRAASALLRLVIQKLCVTLGGKGSNINDDIKLLVAKGLPETIQKSLDSVRVIGNNAVHGGQIDLNDKPEIALVLFKLVNFIVEKMITEPKKIDEVYNLLPQTSLEAIKKRDGK